MCGVAVETDPATGLPTCIAPVRLGGPDRTANARLLGMKENVVVLRRKAPAAVVKPVPALPWWRNSSGDDVILPAPRQGVSALSSFRAVPKAPS